MPTSYCVGAGEGRAQLRQQLSLDLSEALNNAKHGDKAGRDKGSVCLMNNRV